MFKKIRQKDVNRDFLTLINLQFPLAFLDCSAARNCFCDHSSVGLQLGRISLYAKLSPATMRLKSKCPEGGTWGWGLTAD